MGLSEPRWIRGAAIILATAAGVCGTSQAEVFTVTRYDDPEPDGCTVSDCSLREAVIASNADPSLDFINLPAGTITLSRAGIVEDQALTGDLDVLGILEIRGQGVGQTTIDGGGVDRLFHVPVASGQLSLYYLTLTGGGHSMMAGTGGGAVYNQSGYAFVVWCEVIDNRAYPILTGTTYGGAVLSTANLVQVQNSVLRGNSATYGGGVACLEPAVRCDIFGSTLTGNSADQEAGALYNDAEVLVRNSTFSGNVSGGGYLGGIWNSGELTMRHGTVAGNGGYALHAAESTSTAELTNTLIVGPCYGWATGYTSLGGNLESPGNTCHLLPGSDLIDVADPGLMPLAHRGSFPLPYYLPPIHLLLPGSPAMDAPEAVPGVEGQDQRHNNRPIDGDGDAQALTDIGAVEALILEVVFYDGFDSGDLDEWSQAMP